MNGRCSRYRRRGCRSPERIERSEQQLNVPARRETGSVLPASPGKPSAPMGPTSAGSLSICMRRFVCEFEDYAQHTFDDRFEDIGRGGATERPSAFFADFQCGRAARRVAIDLGMPDRYLRVAEPGPRDRGPVVHSPARFDRWFIPENRACHSRRRRLTHSRPTWLALSQDPRPIRAAQLTALLPLDNRHQQLQLVTITIIDGVGPTHVCAKRALS